MSNANFGPHGVESWFHTQGQHPAMDASLLLLKKVLVITPFSVLLSLLFLFDPTLNPIPDDKF